MPLRNVPFGELCKSTLGKVSNLNIQSLSGMKLSRKVLCGNAI